MKELRSYLERQAFSVQAIQTKPAPDLNLVVVIPVHNEPDLLPTLNALAACTPTQFSVEVILVVNASELAESEILERNRASVSQVNSFVAAQTTTTNRTYHFIEANALPKKHAGVGLARKIGMDEAIRRFIQADNEAGVIVCFDADCLCATSYLAEIEAHFLKYEQTPGCSIRYAHPLAGDLAQGVYQGIIRYELFLRYYNQGLAYANFPGAFHTVGSSMAVRINAYAKQGGMNRRKAGEDFYFLHKIISLGGFTELDSTCVYPSPRISDRVPFGTGRAIGQWLEKEQEDYFTYDPECFDDLKLIFDRLTEFYDSEVLVPDEWPAHLKHFLAEVDFEESILEARKYSAGVETFQKRVLARFGAFQILKYVHYHRDEVKPEISLLAATNGLLARMGKTTIANYAEGLTLFRMVEGGE